MFDSVSTDTFLTQLKQHFGFLTEDTGAKGFVSDNGVSMHFRSRTELDHCAAQADSRNSGFWSRPKVFVSGKDRPYSIYSSQTPFAVYLTDYRKDSHTHISIDREHSYLIHLPNSSSDFPEFHSELHRHTFYELVYILDGTLDFVIEGTHRRYRQGEACLLSPDVRHVEENTSSYTAVYLNMDESYLNRILKESPRTAAKTGTADYIDFIPLSDTAGTFTETAQAFYDTVREVLQERPQSEAIVLCLLRRIFAYLQSPKRYTCSQIHFQGGLHQNAVESALHYLQTHRYKLTREELSAATGYNAGYLNRIFNAHIGQSLADYNRQIYLTEAANLLLNTSLSVSEIAGRLHFESRTAFYEQFRRKYQVTPGEYRVRTGSGTLETRKECFL